MLSVVLIVALGLQFALPIDSDLPPTTARLPRHISLPEPVLNADYPEIIQRPLFAPDRQPMIEAMDGLVLLGLGLGGVKPTALLQSAGGPVLRGHPGDQINGWQIAAVTEDRVSFERKGERRILKLDVQSRRALKPPVIVARPQ